MSALVVVKLGGDAVGTPARIAGQARRLRDWHARGPVVAVPSARRGVTDQLLSLVGQVRSAAPCESEPADGFAAAEADRAVAAGELVASALLALALNRLGVRAVSLDAREAGIAAAGPAGHGCITRVRTGRIESLLAQGIVPVVTGFQGWRRDRVVTLGRGGSDTTAVALGAALGASRVLFVKEAAGLRTADPQLVTGTRPIPLASHAFLSALARAGARVVPAIAAETAEQHRVPLEFWTLEGGAADSEIRPGGLTDGGARAVAVARAPEPDHSIVTVVGLSHSEWDERRGQFDDELVELGLGGPPWSRSADGYHLRVPERRGGEAAAAVHRVVLDD
jgi:aspartate kinase